MCPRPRWCVCRTDDYRPYKSAAAFPSIHRHNDGGDADILVVPLDVSTAWDRLHKYVPLAFYGARRARVRLRRCASGKAGDYYCRQRSRAEYRCTLHSFRLNQSCEPRRKVQSLNGAYSAKLDAPTYSLQFAFTSMASKKRYTTRRVSAPPKSETKVPRRPRRYRAIPEWLGAGSADAPPHVRRIMIEETSGSGRRVIRPADQ